jgi:hypothetical protein
MLLVTREAWRTNPEMLSLARATECFTRVMPVTIPRTFHAVEHFSIGDRHRLRETFSAW